MPVLVGSARVRRGAARNRNRRGTRPRKAPRAAEAVGNRPVMLNHNRSAVGDHPPHVMQLGHCMWHVARKPPPGLHNKSGATRTKTGTGTARFTHYIRGPGDVDWAEFSVQSAESRP